MSMILRSTITTTRTGVLLKDNSLTGLSLEQHNTTQRMDTTKVNKTKEGITRTETRNNNVMTMMMITICGELYCSWHASLLLFMHIRWSYGVLPRMDWLHSGSLQLLFWR